MTTAAIGTGEGRHVRVWFGEHVIAGYRADPLLAERYARTVSRRFAGLRITDEPLTPAVPLPEPLPSELMWEIPPR